ncbi:MAG: hypothetical protein ACRDSJ_11305, partial [Rubrobacteraceae bacterium]
GKSNFVKKVSALTSNAKSATLRLVNQRGGAALDLRVKQGKAPMKVNSDTQVANLNADELDGKDSGAFLQNLNGYEIVTSSSAYNTGSLKSTTAYCPSGKRVVSGGARYSKSEASLSRGGNDEIAIQGSGPMFSIDDRWNASADWMGGSGSSPFNWRVIAYAICADE